MKMIPPSVSPQCRSGAERRLFDLLSQVELGPGARAYHSLALPEHERKREGEIDFLVLHATGLLVLEVKGGGISCHDGRWTYTGRAGSFDGGTGPFEQARGAMYSLLERVKNELGPQATRDLSYGYGVAFPDCVFDVVSEEWSAESVLDARGASPAGVRSYLKGLIEYWAAKGRRRAEPTRAAIDAIASFVRPDFDRVPALGAWADEIHTRTVELTENQFTSLDWVEGAARLLFTGGAGTGKTFLAAEVARRHGRAGEMVLLTCQSPTLAAFLRQAVADESVDVMSFDRAVGRSGHPYDVVVLDEAQDLINAESLLELDGLVRGGLQDGRWRIFLDPNNQAGVSGRFEPEALEELAGYAVHAPPLTSNLRNTNQVIMHTRLLTGADLGVATLGDGPRVESVETSDAADDVRKLTVWLSQLDSRHGVAPGDVTILSPRAFEESAARLLPDRLKNKLVIVTPETVRRWPRADMTFSTVAQFKGLENRFIALVDVDETLMAAEARNVLYVALSRARVGLWIAIRTAAQPRVQELVDENLSRLSEAPS
jgi:hypothetical protein